MQRGLESIRRKGRVSSLVCHCNGDGRPDEGGCGGHGEGLYCDAARLNSATVQTGEWTMEGFEDVQASVLLKAC
jgi:hypothetical protein